MHRAVVGVQGSRSAPEVPVEPLGRGGVGGLFAGSAGVFNERSHHANLAGLARLEELHPRKVVRRDAAMGSDLNDLPRVARGFHHGSAFVNGVADRLLDVDVRSCLHGRDGDQRVPVVGRRDDHDFGLFAFEQFAEILVDLGRIARELAGGGLADGELFVVDVAEGDELALFGPQGFAEDVCSPPAGTNQGEPIALASLLSAGDRGSGQRRRRNPGGNG